MGWRPLALRRSSIPAGVVGMLVIVIIVESLLGKGTFDSAHEAAWKRLAKDAEGAAVDKQVLCFGSSLLLFGFYPKVVEARSGLTAWNLALPVGATSSSYFMLKRVIEAGGKPKFAIVEISPFQLAPTDQLEAARVQLFSAFLRLGELRDLASTLPNFEAVTRIGLGKVFPSMRSREEIRKGILLAIKGKSDTERRMQVALLLRSLRRNNGAFVYPPGTRKAGEEEEQHSDFDLMEYKEHAMEYADRFIQLASEHNIQVIAVLPPISPGFQKHSDRIGSSARYDRFLRERMERYPNFKVVDARHSNYTPDLFIDPIHLSRVGGSVLSEDLADIMRRHEVAERWVSLPPYLARMVPGKVEDFTEPQVASVDTQPSARR